MDVKAAAGAYNAIAGIMQQNPATPASSQTMSSEPSFMELVNHSLSNAVDAGHSAEKISSLALLGKADITELATAINSAELALNTVTTLSSKMISAYQQITQMAI